MNIKFLSKKQKGFTAIEILIAVSIIAILAAITLVAYGSLSQAARNQKTVTAVKQWTDALRTYEADEGQYPNPGSFTYFCLGENYPYGYDGQGSSGDQCISGGTFQESSTLLTAMKPYFGEDIPTPDFQAIGDSGGMWYRGIAYFLTGSSSAQIGFVIKGNDVCPTIGNTQSVADNDFNDGKFCVLAI